jgi:hypothetical protein
MKKPAFALFFLLSTLCSFAQFTLNGKVVDAESKEPLPAASVFAQNTTKGTTTDKDGLFHLYLDKGGYELVISFSGYTSKTINVQTAPASDLVIELQKADNSMSEVVIKSSNEVPDGWEKYGDLFLKHFIGASPFADSCTLLNPQAVKFLYYKRNDRVKVLASEPLQISNRALGYQLRFDLDSFVYFQGSHVNSYRGRCFYTELEGDDSARAVWTANRKAAYEGSRLHFLRSYYDSTLSREGFTVALPFKNEPNRFGMLRNPYDTNYYYYNDSTAEAELYFPQRAAITYQKKAPDPRYLEQMKFPKTIDVQTTYVLLRDGIVIKPNGFFFDQSSWTNQGYWSWKNLADQLPYDYEPPR